MIFGGRLYLLSATWGGKSEVFKWREVGNLLATLNVCGTVKEKKKWRGIERRRRRIRNDDDDVDVCERGGDGGSSFELSLAFSFFSFG